MWGSEGPEVLRYKVQKVQEFATKGLLTFQECGESNRCQDPGEWGLTGCRGFLAYSSYWDSVRCHAY